VKRSAISLACVAAAFALTTVGVAAATSYPNDYFFVEGDQWALTGSAASINAPAAWCASTGSGIVVADVDTGANFGHPDLAGKLIAGAAFLGGSAPDKAHPTGTGQAAVQDDHGHGSMTTGIVVADSGNGQGIASVAPDARALIVKVLDSGGSGYESDVADGIEWAVDHGANVINLSIGPGDIAGTGVAPPGTPATSLIPGAIKYAYQHGVAVAVAAGNSGISTADYISLAQGMQAVTVGALGPNDTVASYSNYGYGVSVYAPGGDAPSQDAASVQNMIVSTGLTHQYPEYLIGEGTSFAAPQVAGALAQLMATGRSASQAMNAVVNTATTSADGFRQLNAAAALGRSKGALCGSPSTAGTVAPPGGVTVPNGQHQAVPPPPTARPAGAPASRSTAPPAPATTAHATPTPTGGVGAVEQAGAPPPQAGRSGPPAAATNSGQGGARPSPLLLASLVAVIVVGAPLGTRAVRALRRRTGPG
jgi:subtilisin family serine protease